MSFTFGIPKTATGFTLPASTTTTTTPAIGGTGDARTLNKEPSLFATPSTTFTGFGLNAPTATTAPTTGFSLGGFQLGSTAATTVASSAAPVAATSAQSGFPLSATPNIGATGFKLAATAAATTASPTPKSTTAISFGPPTASTKTTASIAPQFSLATSTTTATTTSSSFTPILGISTTSAAAASTTTTATPLKIGSLATSIAATSAASVPTGIAIATTSATAAATITATPVPQTGTLTYAQLEDSINKWTIDLEEQGKLFINQAKELNAWDNLLISSGDRILNLNETIERVKQQQKQLDQELDFVLAQQNELDELSLPLEKQLADIPITDQNRFQTYQLSEIIDSQLKQMSEDLKEIVEHLNESNKNEDTSDPVIQISRILNAHMNSLQWIDRNTTQITGHLEQISKLQELHKKNQLNY